MIRSQRRPNPIRRGAQPALVLVTAVFLLLTTGCSAPTGEPEPEVTQELPAEPDPEPEPEPEEPPTPEVYWPLTGVAVEQLAGALDEDGDFGPVLSVKIENSEGSRPQDGLEAADVVWEQLVEGGMTRFVAMYHSDVPERLGPIRSLRPMDAAIAGPFGGILAFSGGQHSYQARAAQAGLMIASHDAGHAGFYVNPERSSSHRLFGEPEVFLGSGEGLEPAPEPFVFAQEGERASALAGEAVGGVDLAFPASFPSWEWDGAVWQRSESGVPAVMVSGERLRAHNVLVAHVQFFDTGARDAAGSPVFETILTGEGRLDVFSGGHTIEGTWEKSGDAEPMRLYDLDGNDIALAPGNTWVELLPVTGGMSIHRVPEES